MKTKKIMMSIMVSMLICSISYAETAVEIGKVTCIKRILDGNDEIQVIRIDDPENPFVSIYITHVISGELFSLSDPSNTAIACRLTGKIEVDSEGNQKINKKSNLDIAHFRKSVGSKVMHIARWYDSSKNVLVYVVYTTKILDGSLKHSLSVVPLGQPLSP